MPNASTTAVRRADLTKDEAVNQLHRACAILLLATACAEDEESDHSDNIAWSLKQVSSMLYEVVELVTALEQ